MGPCLRARRRASLSRRRARRQAPPDTPSATTALFPSWSLAPPDTPSATTALFPSWSLAPPDTPSATTAAVGRQAGSDSGSDSGPVPGGERLATRGATRTQGSGPPNIRDPPVQAAWGTRATPGGGAGGGLAPGRCCGGGGGGGKRGGRHLDAAVTSEVDGGGEVAAHQPAEGVKPEREGAGGGGASGV